MHEGRSRQPFRKLVGAPVGSARLIEDQSWRERRSSTMHHGAWSRNRCGSDPRQLGQGRTNARRVRALLALVQIIVMVALVSLGPIVSQIFQNVGSNLQVRLVGRFTTTRLGPTRSDPQQLSLPSSVRWTCWPHLL